MADPSTSTSRTPAMVNRAESTGAPLQDGYIENEDVEQVEIPKEEEEVGSPYSYKILFRNFSLSKNCGHLPDQDFL